MKIGSGIGALISALAAGVLLLGFSASASAGEQVGTITQAKGDVHLFRLISSPGKEMTASSPHVLFEGLSYTVSRAKVGDKIEKGNVLRTAPGAKARVVYDNGDQFNVGPATAYKISWDSDSPKGKTQVDLMYGKIRGIVTKGPRSWLKIRTASATLQMGVRGTDFFIADQGFRGGTEVSILRGAVEVKPELPKTKPVEVKAGFSASVPPPPVKAEELVLAEKAPDPKALVVDVYQTSKQELQGIQKSSEIVQADQPKTVAVSEEISKTIEMLEYKAFEATLQDIRVANPKLYAKIQILAEKPQSIEDLNQAAVTTLLKEAPEASARRKPFKSEIENLEEDAYDRYFKQVN